MRLLKTTKQNSSVRCGVQRRVVLLTRALVCPIVLILVKPLKY
jgi:hypothetical protein